MEKGDLSDLKAYLQYLIECDIKEIYMPQHPLPMAHDRGHPVDPVKSSPQEQLAAIRSALGNCMECPLSRNRKNIVFGEGNPCADILFVGEGPGSDEDRTGRPFVGKAGQLLTRIIENGMKIPRASVYICNIVKCRPPENRTPREDEIQTCLPFLEQQIDAVQPKVIVTLGLPASQTLLRTDKPMRLLRGNWHDYRGIPVMPVFHPSYVLRQYTVPVRRQVQEDTQEVLRFLAETTESH